MMLRKTFFIILLVGFAFSSCSTKLQVSKLYSTYKRIDVGGGSEDFLLDTIQGNRLLISCDKRREKIKQGNIWLYNFDSKKANLIPFSKELSFNFHPHGIFMLTENDTSYLFVINHENDHKSEIDRFIVTSNQLILDQRFTDVVGSPNDLFAVGKNEFYYSDYKTFGGSIVHYNGEYEKIVRNLNYPNGIYIENSTLFFSTTINGHLYKVDLNNNIKQKLARVKGADNVMQYSTNELLVTSHPKFIKFAKHAINSLKHSPSVVYRVNKNNKEKELMFYDDGSKISATSTALYYEGKLYLGQVFDPFILVVE